MAERQRQNKARKVGGRLGEDFLQENKQVKEDLGGGRFWKMLLRLPEYHPLCCIPGMTAAFSVSTLRPLGVCCPELTGKGALTKKP